jgi:hypothetical protein
MFMILPRETVRGAPSREQLFPIFLQTGFVRYAARVKINFRPRIRVIMLSRDDFVFTIGYDGPVAVVDNQAKRKYGKLTTSELAEKGLFRAAYSSAVYSKDPKELELVMEAYKRLGKNSSIELNTLERLFGVSLIDVKRSISL